MSIYIYAFLGSRIEDIEPRFVRAFAELGFHVEIHPKMRLLEPNQSPCLYMAVHATPVSVRRLAPDVPLLVGFGYKVTPPRDDNPRTKLRPFRNIEGFTYEVCTSTSSGRSRSSYFIQALTAAILAKETGGYFYVNGDAEAATGEEGLNRVLSELAGLNAAAKQLETFLSDLQSKAGDGNRESLKAMEHDLNIEFDINAFPFESWPPSDTGIRFEWPAPIRAQA